MYRKFTATLTAASFVIATAFPAYALDGAGINQSRGVAAKVTWKMPFGGSTRAENRTPALSFHVDYTRQSSASDVLVDTSYQTIRFTDLRFSPRGSVDQFKLGQIDVLDIEDDERLNMFGNMGNASWLYILGAIALGVGLYLIIDDGNNDTPSDSPTS
jgi:hypothetical protein